LSLKATKRRWSRRNERKERKRKREKEGTNIRADFAEEPDRVRVTNTGFSQTWELNLDCN